jgi:hypothetical protein
MTGEQVADACSCNSTCDNTCSECVYFLAGTVQQVMAWVLFCPHSPLSCPSYLSKITHHKTSVPLQ